MEEEFVFPAVLPPLRSLAVACGAPPKADLQLHVTRKAVQHPSDRMRFGVRQTWGLTPQLCVTPLALKCRPGFTPLTPGICKAAVVTAPVSEFYCADKIK